MKDMLKILDAKYLHDHVMWIKFSINEEFDLDLTPMLEGDDLGVFEPLKQIEFFKKFHVDYTICWDGELEVAPEYFYFLAHRNDASFQELFKEWGYIT